MISAVNSMYTTFDSSGNVVDYRMNVSSAAYGDRTALLMCVPEEYQATLEADEKFKNDDNNKGQLWLEGDDNVISSASIASKYIGGEFDPSLYEGVLSNEVTDNYDGGVQIDYVFYEMKKYKSTGGLDTDKSYAAFLVLRTANHSGGRPNSIFRNVGLDKKAILNLLPIKINLNKQALDGTYTETSVNTHAPENIEISYDNWPVENIAGPGYHINETKSSGAGICTAISGTVAGSNRRANDITIYYDLDQETVTFNANGGFDAPASQTITYGAVATEPLTHPYKAGYACVGWSTNSGASTADFDFSTPITTTTALYAVWKPHTHGMWHYEKSGETLTAECQETEGAEICDLPNRKVGLTLTAASITYDGNPVTAHFGEGEVVAWEAAFGASAPSITYSKKNGEVYDPIASAVNVGEYNASISAGGIALNAGFTISPQQIADADVTISPVSYIGDGTVKEPTVTVVVGGTTLVKGTDYTLTGVTTASAFSKKNEITVTGKGNYTGTVSKSWKILQAPPEVGPGDLQAHVVDVTTDTIIVNTPSPAGTVWEYKGETGSWQDSPALTGYAPKSGPHTVYVRVKGTESADPSVATSITGIYTRPLPPEPGEGIIIIIKDEEPDKGKPEVFVDDDHEISTDPEFEPVLTSKPAIVTPGTIIYVREKGTPPSIGTPNKIVATVAITVRPNNEAYGTAEVTGPAANAEGIYEIGTSLTLMATPAEGYIFKKWSDNMSTSASRTYTVKDNAIITAIFELDLPQWEKIPGNHSKTYDGIPLTADSIKDELAVELGYTPKYTLNSAALPAVNAGTYVVTATLEEGYVWEDKASGAKSFNYTIKKVKATTAPAFIVDEDGDKVFDTTPKAIEISTDGGITWTKKQPPYKVPTLPGIYYVRFPGDENHEPSNINMVKVTTPYVFPGVVVPSTSSAIITGNASTTAILMDGHEYPFNLPLGDAPSYTITGLSPDTEYTYRLTDGHGNYSEPVTFRTKAVENLKIGEVQVTVGNSTGETKDITISIEQGNTVLYSRNSTVPAHGSSSVKFLDMPYGYYNVVVRDTKGVFTETRGVDLESGAAHVDNIIIPEGQLSTKVEVKGNAPKIAVENLNLTISGKDTIMAKAGVESIDIKLGVEQETAATAEGAGQIQAMFESEKTADYLNLSLTKTTSTLSEGEVVSTVMEDMGSSNEVVMRIAIPYNTSKSGLWMYRYHDGIAQKLIKLNVEPTGGFLDGNFYIAKDYMVLYASGFSTYAIVSDNPATEKHRGRSKAPITTPEAIVTEITPAGVTAVARPEVTGTDRYLITDDHIVYINGRNDGKVYPNDYMKRAEVAQLFYNLLKDQNVAITTGFADVKDGSWYAKAVNSLASMGILTGRGVDGNGNSNFEPNQPVTRAEFTAIAMRFAYEISGHRNFLDVPQKHWAYDLIGSAAEYGWINGYKDGTFGPGNNITRAEVVTIVNHILGRTPDKAYIDANAAALNKYSDLESSKWYYYDMVEASKLHDYDWNEDYTETWK